MAQVIDYKQATLVLIFNEKRDEILMLKRNKHPYKGLFNALGGKIEDWETPITCAYREIFEEAGIKEPHDMYPAMVINYPSGWELHVYYCWIEQKDVPDTMLTEEGMLYWVSIRALLDIKNSYFAGDGNLTYFTWDALKHWGRV